MSHWDSLSNGRVYLFPISQEFFPEKLYNLRQLQLYYDENFECSFDIPEAWVF